MTRRRYKYPPIDEALCEIRFSGCDEWDLTVPGNFHARIKDKYPGKPRVRDEFQAGIQKHQPSSSVLLKLNKAEQKIQFPSEDGTRLAAIGSNSLSVHALRPYVGWDEEFRDQVHYALNAYLETVSPLKAIRIGIRYINKISIYSAGVVELDEYFTTPPQPPNRLPVTMTSLFCRTEYQYEDSSVRLVKTFASAEQEEGKQGFILDLDLIWQDPESPLELTVVMEKIEELRAKERDAFESLITDKTRRIFDND